MKNLGNNVVIANEQGRTQLVVTAINDSDIEGNEKHSSSINRVQVTLLSQWQVNASKQCKYYPGRMMMACSSGKPSSSGLIAR